MAASPTFTISFCLHGRNEDRADVIDGSDEGRNARTPFYLSGRKWEEETPLLPLLVPPPYVPLV